MESSAITVNWLAVLVATVAAFVIGGLWYGPLFGKVWMRASGVNPDRLAQANPAVTYGVSFLLLLIAAYVLAMFIGPGAAVAFAAGAGFSVGALWVGGTLGVIYLFEARPMAHWAVNAGYAAVTFTVMGVILGLWS